MKQIRLAINTHHWDPSESVESFLNASSTQEFQHALSCIHPDERARITRKLVREDAKMALVGRLLISAMFVKEYSCSWKELRFSRTKAGKPYLERCSETNVFKATNVIFNISHHGGWVVLAAAESCAVGIDVMTLEIPGKRAIPVQDFFVSFQDQFTQSEWDYINRPADDKKKLRRFIQYWCLKESYVKAIGVGIVVKLASIEFGGLPEDDNITQPNAPITLRLNGIPNLSWHFELSDLADDHCVAVALAKRPDDDSAYSDKTRFEVMQIEELLAHAEGL
ncbi:4'-phosphopantetheinyl transferase superfamily [Jimgerdemannia flammicorona]|uniref:4'-phosphopantetheinyl transferase superfamily n=2 Tax=Jimgerdemannia flammicorona TaxID=994334 RepID=A0A433BJS0_9FUNG|nr:4'-phosphopantetheinyl transferase superfamily [Jimgerdemannia flammicorona]RUS33944.1 4'-phosphopantetheinyl transferase superfamily [Jimgerdemannia flammicorona]